MKVKHWIIKIFLITLLLSAGISLISEVFIADMPIGAAIGVLLVIILVGIVFDVIGVAVSTCDEAPIIAMCAKKIKKARYALPLIKNADIVANFCNDVVGDICGIVSGSAGAAIAAKILLGAQDNYEMWVGIMVSALIAALTVGGKAFGKKIAMKKNKEIVVALGSVLQFFSFKK